jgi:predicted nucleotidyltransferase
LGRHLPLVRVALCGSYAKGDHGGKIDLLIIYKGEERADAYPLVKRTLGIPRLEPHLYTEAEYQQAKELLAKMTKGGVVLFPKVDSP